MAFGFLSGVADLVTAGAGLVGAFRGRKEPAVSREQADIARQAAEFAELSVSPDDPRFKNLLALFDERNRRANIQAIGDVFKQHRRSLARGGPGFFVNPERRDESVAQALSRNFQLGAEGARNETRRAFLDASNASTGAASGLSDPAELAADYEALNRENLASGIEAGGDVLRSLGDVFSTRRTWGRSDPMPREFWGNIWNQDPRFTGWT